ncbi:hypothetical protein R1flu_025365 [Riccia fluitans]|uniref:Uncharacterized protein n=1 Tax=Riccia fluitans TaxID=41844 RepID=A0ABD1XXJ3_9MARC
MVGDKTRRTAGFECSTLRWLLKGNFLDSELESIRVDNGSERDRVKHPFLQPPSLLQIEEVVEASDSDEQDKGNSACRSICLESETAGPVEKQALPSFPFMVGRIYTKKGRNEKGVRQMFGSLYL